jgi:hypothetical protein
LQYLEQPQNVRIGAEAVKAFTHSASVRQLHEVSRQTVNLLKLLEAKNAQMKIYN